MTYRNYMQKTPREKRHTVRYGLAMNPKIIPSTASVPVHHIYQAFLWPVSHGARPALCPRLSGANHKQDVPVSVLVLRTGLCSNQEEDKTSRSKNRGHQSLQAGFRAILGHWGTTASGWAGSSVSLLESWSKASGGQILGSPALQLNSIMLFLYSGYMPLSISVDTLRCPCSSVFRQSPTCNGSGCLLLHGKCTQTINGCVGTGVYFARSMWNGL